MFPPLEVLYLQAEDENAVRNASSTLCPLFLGMTPSPPSPAFQLEGKDLYFTKLSPKLCALRTLSSLAHVCVSGR